MDYLKILKRAWHIVWNYKLLWIFGILLAITTVSTYSPPGGGGSSGRDGSSSSGESFNAVFAFNDFVEQVRNFDLSTVPDIAIDTASNLGAAVDSNIWMIIIAAVIVSIILGVIIGFIRYISETSLIKMVDLYEEEETKVSFGKGFRLGWSASAFKLFLIDLVIYIPAVLITILIFAVTALPLLLMLTKTVVFSVIGIILTVLMAIVAILLVLVFFVLLSLIINFVRRMCVLQGEGVFSSIRKAVEMVRNRFVEAGIMWLIMLGVQIVFNLGMIPVGFIVLVFAVLVAGIPFALVTGLVYLFAAGNTGLILGGIVAGLIFAIIMFVVISFLSGVFESYKSSVWTLTWREFNTADQLEEQISSDDENLLSETV